MEASEMRRNKVRVERLDTGVYPSVAFGIVMHHGHDIMGNPRRVWWVPVVKLNGSRYAVLRPTSRDANYRLAHLPTPDYRVPDEARYQTRQEAKEAGQRWAKQGDGLRA